MKETFFTNCVNCGHQVLVESLASICYWCHRNASKKDKKQGLLTAVLQVETVEI